MANKAFTPAELASNIAFQTAKKASPKVSTTPAPLQSLLKPQSQQSQAISTNNIPGVGLPQVNNPVKTAVETPKTPDILPTTGVETNKTLSKDRVVEIIKNAPAGADKKAIVNKLIERGYTLEGYGADKPSTVENIAGGLVKSGLDSELAEPGQGAIKFLGENVTKPLVGLLPESGFKQKLLKNIEGNIQGSQKPQETLVPGADTSSTAFKGAKLVGDIVQTAILPGPKIKQGVGFIKGALQLGLQGGVETAKYTAVAEKRLPTPKELAYGVGGNIILGGLMNVGKILPKKTAKNIEEIAGEIVQGKKKDVVPAIKTLTKVDTKGVTSYDDLGEKIIESNQNVIKLQDKILSADKRKFMPSDFEKTYKAGQQTVTNNYVTTAINHLKELYEKFDPKEYARILNLEDGFIKGKLGVKQINDIARKYNQEFGQKAFGANGEALTSVNAQQYEAVRSGVKEAVREKLPNGITKKLDSQYSAGANTLELVNKMAEKVNTLKQKVKPMGLIENIANKTGKVINALTGGGLKGFIASIIPSNVGNKVMNSIDIEKALVTNLKKLAELSSKVDKGTATKADLELIQKYVASFGSAGASNMGK